MAKIGRPKGPKNSQKQPFSIRLKPALIKKIKKRADEIERSKNYLVEKALEKEFAE